MAKTVFETKTCTRCGAKRFSQVRFVACAAETSFRIIGPWGGMGKWYYFYEDLEVWKFPLCNKCLGKGLISHLEFENKRLRERLTIFLVGAVFGLLGAIFLVDPTPHPWSLLEVAIAFLLFASIIASIGITVEIIKIRLRLRALRSSIAVSSGDYDTAFSGEAEHIMNVHKGSVANNTFPVPKFADMPSEKLQDAIDLSRELKVVAVGNTLRETIERLPKEWKGFVGSFNTQ